MLDRLRGLRRPRLQGGAAGDASVARGRQIASNIVQQLFARGFSMAISIVTVSLTARTLDPSGYGVLNGMGAYVGLFGALTDLGLTTVSMQRMAADPERESEWLGALVGARTALALVASVVCAATVPLLSDAHGAHVVGWIVTATVLSTGPQALMAVFQSRLRGIVSLSFSMLQSALWLVIVIVLASLEAGVVAFAAANIGVLAVIGVLQVRTTRRFAHIAWRAGRRLWGELIRIALPVSLASLFIVIYIQIDSVLLLQISGAHEAGIYAAAYTFLSPLIFLPAAVMSSLSPVISAVFKDDPDRVRRLVQIGADLMALVSLPILAGSIALSGPIIHTLYGSGYSRTAGLLPILMIAYVAICYGNLAGFLAPVLGLQWRLAVFSGIGLAANVALNLVLIPPDGAYGSAWATVATECMTMIMMLIATVRTLHLALSVKRIGGVLALAAAMTGVMALAAPLGLIPAGLLGVLFYAGGLVALRLVDLQELRALASQPA